MTDQELIKQLKRISILEDPKLRCLGCGHEHSCSLHGCAIIKAAAERLEELVSSLDTKAKPLPLCRMPQSGSDWITDRG